MTDTLGALGDAALTYGRDFGWCVFWVPSGAKIPTRGSHGYKDATNDEAVIRGLWAKRPTANIAIATGAASGVFVTDIDIRNGGDKSFRELLKTNGRLPTTLTARTGGGGWHHYWQHEPGIRNSAGKIGNGIDVRGDGGHVIAPPSTHRNGTRYAWVEGRAPSQTPIARAPRWLIEAARASSDTSGVGAPPERWRRIFAEGAGEGRRNDTIARLTGHFLSRGHDPWLVLDLMQMFNAQRCHPPLSAEEVTAVVDSICKCKRARG